MGVGRALCVALPFILTGISLVTLLIVGLAGVTGSTLSIFEVAPKDLSISLEDLQDLKVNGNDLKIPQDWLDQLGFEDSVNDAIDQYGGVNVTAAKLGLGDKYNFYLWNYEETNNGKKVKSDAEFDYASNFTNTSHIGNLAEGTGLTLEVPDEIEDALKVFANLIKWSQIVFCIAVVAAGVALIVGISSFFSRIGSCITWVVSSIATAAIIAFAVLTTVTASVVVGIITAATKNFGVDSSVSTSWLAVIWVGVACAIASWFFWMFTICCCKGSSTKSGKRHSIDDNEKLIGPGPRGYQQVQDPYMHGSQQSGINQPQFSIPMGNVKTSRAQAYEPYSHHAS